MNKPTFLLVLLFAFGICLDPAWLCSRCDAQTIRYYDRSGRYQGNNSIRNQSSSTSMNTYMSDGRYVGRSASQGNNIEYYDRSGRLNGRSRVNAKSGRSDFYDNTGRYGGHSQTTGDTTNVYDRSGRLVQKHQTSSYGVTRVYDSSGRYLGNADKSGTMSSNYLARKALTSCEDCKK